MAADLLATFPSFAALDLDDVRMFLHLLGVSGWVGGQILMLGLLGVLRGLGAEAPRLAADRFGKVAWPCFALAVVTGIWNLAEVGLSGHSDGYLSTMLVKLILVGASGAAAAVHSTARSAVLRGATGGIGFLAALGALLAGAALSS
jgi:putative copper export protein